MPSAFAEELDPVATLRSVALFSSLSDDALRELAAEMRLISCADGETLVAQGGQSARLLVIVSGALSVSQTAAAGTVTRLHDVLPPAAVGDISLVSDIPAAATVRALGDVVVAELTRAGFERFTERRPADAWRLIDALGPQLHRRRLQLALRQSATFRDLDPAVLADLESEFEPVALYSGEVLYRRGETGGDTLHIVVTGRVRVVRRSVDGVEAVLAELGPGETVGEMAIITGEPRSADVYAIRDTQLARLSKAAVERVLERHPKATLLLLAGGLANRVRHMSSGARRNSAVATIALVPATPGVALDAIGERMRASLSHLGSTLLLTSERIDAQLGSRGAAQAYDRDGGSTRLLEWLTEREREHRFVLYQADGGCSPWTERTLRQADHIVIVADTSADPAPGEIETELLNREATQGTGRTLALVWPDGAPLRGTARWLVGRTVERHLHLGRPADCDRLARVMTGNAIGLVLGGGFARGLAHIGVLRALAERNIAIDLIGGSSMGAMVGGLWASGWDSARIVQEISTGFAQSFDDMTVPFLSFKRGGKHTAIVKRFFGDTQIEDLPLPYFCTSANLNRADLMVHTSGSMATAVLASTRAPGVFPPVVINGELHVDGGLVNNTPADVMKTFSNDGIVIGIDVSPPHELNLVADYGADVSGWDAFWMRFKPAREKRVYRPSILLVLMRVIELGGIANGRAKVPFADLYIEPELLRFKRNDFHAAAEMAEVGYRATSQALDQWLANGRPAYGLRRPDLFPARAD